jgi:ABC-type antimicrobial peptide transport system permease subunit
MALKRVGVLVGVRVLAGAAISPWASQYVATLLFELQARDPLTLIVSVLVLVTTGVLAGWLPAVCAARIDPRVLREG